MNEGLIPVLITALIVFGVVSGSVIRMISREVIPLLRTLVQERRQDVAGPVDAARLASLEQRVAELEATHHRLWAENEFLHRLVEARPEQSVLPGRGE